MYWRNMKMNIMIGIIIGGVVLYIFLPMLPDDAFSWLFMITRIKNN